MIDTVRVVDGRWGIVFQAGEWRALGLLHVIGAAGGVCMKVTPQSKHFHWRYVVVVLCPPMSDEVR